MQTVFSKIVKQECDVIEIRPAGQEQLEWLIQVVSERVAVQADQPAPLSAQVTQISHWRPPCTWLLENGSGYAAYDCGELSGVMIAIQQNAPFFGKDGGIFVPDFGWGVQGKYESAIFERLYAVLCQDAFSTGKLNHLITVQASAKNALGLLHQVGFGNHSIDAAAPIVLATLKPAIIDSHIHIRQGTPEDLPAIQLLKKQLLNHIESSPCLNYSAPENIAEWMDDWLCEEGDVGVVAEKNNQLIGYVHAGDPRWDVTRMVHTQDDLAINGAYLMEAYRGGGIFDSLLACLCELGMAAQKTRLSVDFESANPTARHYWLRHFTPVGISLLRHVDERLMTQ
jgi:hypothetical protein